MIWPNVCGICGKAKQNCNCVTESAAKETKKHYLKTWPEYFSALKDGRKTFELRYNDRQYNIGDIIVCQEYDNDKKQYTGEELYFTINYKTCWNDDIIMGNALKVGYCILGLKKFKYN